MPELPEVETVRRYLESVLLNKKVNNVKLFTEKCLRNTPKNSLRALIGQRVTSIDRIAKHLIIRFDKHYLLLHLRMEGKLIYMNRGELSNIKPSHIILTIDTDDGVLVFKDFRLFATVDLFTNDIPYETNPVLVKVGPEPFDTNGNYLFGKLKNKRIAIKSALLDQSIISGLGNIYVNEVLFHVGILPTKESNKVTEEQCKDIIKWSKKVLNDSIKVGGSSIHSYTFGENEKGGYQDKLVVHGLKQCKKCGTTIEKISVGGRGTYYCPKCQK